MSDTAKRILHDALELDDPDRALVAAKLLASLDGPADPDAEAEWALEIERRVREIDSGTVELSPWSDVRRRLASQLPPR